MKRYFYIIIGIIVIAIIAIAVILYLKNPSSLSSTFSDLGISGLLPQTGTQSNTSSGVTVGNGANGQSGTSTNTAAEGGLVQAFTIAAEGPALDYFVDAKNNITMIRPDGVIIAITDQASSTLSGTAIPNVLSASFSHDGKKILVNSGEAANPKTNIFDVTSKIWTSAPQGMQSPQWAPSGYQIAYLTQLASGSLSLATIDASNLKKASVVKLSLHATDMSLQWIAQNQFILSDKPTSQNSGSLWLFDATKGTLTPVAYEQAGTESIWGNTKDGVLGLVMKSLDKSASLRLLQPSGTIYHAVSIVTLPSKCSFATGTTSSTSSMATSSKTVTTTTSYLYCGIPLDSTALSNAQLPDDYNMMSLFTSDVIVRVNITTGGEDELWNDPSQNMDVSDLKLFNNSVFFINRYDQKIYKLTLTSQGSTSTTQ